MSTITIGSAPLDLTGSASSRSTVSTDPDAFAAELQSATENENAGASTASDAATVGTTGPTGTDGIGTDGTGADATAPDTTGTGATATAPVAPAGSPQSSSVTATPIATAAQPADPATGVAAPTQPAAAEPAAAEPEAVPVPANVAPIVPAQAAPAPAESAPADAAQTATAQTATAQSDAIASDPAAAAVSPAPSALSPTPVAHRGPRHATTDVVPSPMAATDNSVALAAASLPPATSTAALSAAVSLPVAQTSDDESPAVAVAAVAPLITSPLGATTAPANQADDSTDSERAAESPRPSQVPAAPVPILPTLAASAPVAATTAVGNNQRPVARITTNSAADPASFAAALAQPSVSHTAPTTPAAAPAAPQLAPSLSEQIAPPLLALRNAGAGTHTLTLTVSPDSVGPVTVRVHVTGDAMRVELSAPTDQGTDALKSMLPDLKRDLSQGGVNSALTIASPGSDGSAAGNQNAFGGAGGSFARDERPNYFRNANPASLPATAGSPRPISVGATSALDVLA
jgi:flagellar hook-length control protein FliK